MIKYKQYLKENVDNVEEESEQIEQLKHFLGLLFKNSGIFTYQIEADGLNFHVYIQLEKTEPLKKLVKILDICKKLHTDVLIQYVVEVDLWETTTGFPLLTVSFFLDEDSDDIPDDEEDLEDEHW
jgi:hypothetical protein